MNRRDPNALIPLKCYRRLGYRVCIHVRRDGHAIWMVKRPCRRINSKIGLADCVADATAQANAWILADVEDFRLSK
ncbi:MAG: hypothetical protein ABI411_11700 [Tahibacter sp.]